MASEPGYVFIGVVFRKCFSFIRIHYGVIWVLWCLCKSKYLVFGACIKAPIWCLGGLLSMIHLRVLISCIFPFHLCFYLYSQLSFLITPLVLLCQCFQHPLVSISLWFPMKIYDLVIGNIWFFHISRNIGRRWIYSHVLV